MKKNISLALLLIALLFATWLIQERGVKLDKEAKQKREQVFNPSSEGGLLELHLGEVVLYKKGELFEVGESHVAAGAARVEEVFSILSDLAVVRVLESDEAAALKPELSFPGGKTSKITFVTPKKETVFEIGAMLPTSNDRFYAKLADKTLIIQDRRPMIEAYRQEDEGALREERLRNVFSAPESMFYDGRIFREPYRITKAAFDNNLAKPYSVNFKNFKTKPRPYESLAYDISEFDVWRGTLETLEVQTLHSSYDAKKLDDYRASLKLENDSGKKVELTLFGKYGSLRGDFVISSLSPQLYEFNDNLAGLFFQNMQDFWELSLLSGEQAQQLKLSAGKETFTLLFEPGAVFNVKVISQKVEPRRDRLAVFYALVTGRSHYVSETEGKIAHLKEHFIIQSGVRSFTFAEIDQEWLIIDSANDVAYHYRKRDFPDLSGELSQYFGKPQ